MTQTNWIEDNRTEAEKKRRKLATKCHRPLNKMAKILATLAVCLLLSSLRLSEGKPVPPRLSFAKTATSMPAQQVDGDTKEPEEPTTSLDDCSQFCSESYPQHTYPIVRMQK